MSVVDTWPLWVLRLRLHRPGPAGGDGAGGGGGAASHNTGKSTHQRIARYGEYHMLLQYITLERIVHDVSELSSEKSMQGSLSEPRVNTLTSDPESCPLPRPLPLPLPFPLAFGRFRGSAPLATIILGALA